MFNTHYETHWYLFNVTDLFPSLLLLFLFDLFIDVFESNGSKEILLEKHLCDTCGFYRCDNPGHFFRKSWLFVRNFSKQLRKEIANFLTSVIQETQM